MPEDIKRLIEKIQQEGIAAAEDKAKAIEDAARKQAQEILQKAKADAEKMLTGAQSGIAKMEENSQASLKQAGRDMLLALRKEISNILDRIIISHIREALAPEELAKIIGALAKSHTEKGSGDIIVSLNKEMLEKVEKKILNEVKEEAQKGITLRPAEEIHAGFTISFDSGKSQYDFTDKALAEYIATFLKPKLAELLSEDKS